MLARGKRLEDATQCVGIHDANGAVERQMTGRSLNVQNVESEMLARMKEATKRLNETR